MVSARLLIKVGLASLGTALSAVGAIALGLEQLRPIALVAVTIGALAVAVGLVARLSGTLEDDLRD